MMDDALGLSGEIQTEDGKSKKVKYTMDGRWWENGSKYIRPCGEDHKYKHAGVLFTEDGALLRIWYCDCNYWCELNTLLEGDKQVWTSLYYD